MPDWVCLQLKASSILVEPDVPIYDLREVMQQVGFPVGPRAPLFDKLQVTTVVGKSHTSPCAHDCLQHHTVHHASNAFASLTSLPYCPYH